MREPLALFSGGGGYYSKMVTMRTGHRVEARQRAQTKTHISATTIQGLEILSLSVTQLEEYLHSAAEGNPLLDVEYCQEGVSFDELAMWRVPTSRDEGKRRRYYQSASTAGYTEVDFNRLADACTQTETLQFHLDVQINRGPGRSSRELAVLRALISCIDQNGYFAGNLNQLAREASISLEEAEGLLSEIQSLDPPGVGARTVAECLLLQLTGKEKHYECIKDILENDLEDFAENRLTALMASHGLSRDDLREVKEEIRRLNPRPGALFARSGGADYVVPDLFITPAEEGFEVAVASEAGVRLVMSEEYANLAESRRLGAEEAHWLEERQTDALNILRNINHRKQTLQRLGTYLVKAQYDFFRLGPQRLRPLTMQQVADALGVHVSTVSRTVQDKWVLTSWGCFPLKYFFSARLEASSAGAPRSAQSVKARIKELIDGEDSRSPYSDAALTKVLNEEGVDIKRRTVAKYREALGIACQSKRRF